MAFNERSFQDNRVLLSGKDAVIYNADGELLSTVDTFTSQVNFTNAAYQPLGTALQGEFMTGYSVTITLTQCIIESDMFIQDIFDFFKNGRHAPNWQLSSVLKGYDGSEERIVYYDCVPSGQWDLHNITVGDIVKRNWSLHVNQPPELQKMLTAG